MIPPCPSGMPLDGVRWRDKPGVGPSPAAQVSPPLTPPEAASAHMTKGRHFTKRAETSSFS